MKPGESFGNVTDLHDDLSGGQGTLVYLKGRSEKEVTEQYEAIKSVKSIITAYGMNGRHYLVIMVGGIVKRVTKKTTNNRSK